MRRLVATIALFLASTACDDGTAPRAILELDVTPADTVISVGDTIQLAATAPADTSIGDAILQWTSSDPSVASVAADGQVVGLAVGTATIEVSGADALGKTTVEVRGPVRWTQVGFTAKQTCALDEEGKVYCWIDPDNLVEGYRDEGVRFTALSAGCGLSESGQAYCWSSADVARTEPPIPTAGKRIESPEPFQQLAGGEAGCGITLSGRVRCWDTGTTSSDPVLGTEGVVEIAYGWRRSCALDDAGHVLCWGAGRMGELGTGVREDSTATAVPVESTVAFEHLSVGPDHACALTAEGEAYCWGQNEGLQLGRESCDIYRPGYDPGRGYCSRPSRVETDLRFEEIRALNDATCGLVESGDVFCWGADNAGILGPQAPEFDGHQCRVSRVLYACSMTPVALSPGIGFERLTRSTIAALCGITGDGDELCWGAVLRSGAATGHSYGYPPQFEQPAPLPEPNHPANRS